MGRLKRNRKQKWQTLHSISYNEKKVLGTGRNGTLVFKGKFGERIVAVKKLACAQDSELKEVEILKTCVHENILGYFENFKISSSSIIVLELCDGTLKNWVMDKNPDITGLEILSHVTTGLAWLHNHGVIHLNINPENILIVNGSGKAKIAGFGSAIRISDGAFITKPVYGVNGFVCSELLAVALQEEPAQCVVTKEADIFALGCVYYYVLTDGKNVFGNDFIAHANVLLGLPLIMLNDVKYTCSQNVLFIQLMISSKAELRPGYCEWLLRSPLFWNENQRVQFLQHLESNCKSEYQEVLNFNTQHCSVDHQAEMEVLGSNVNKYKPPCAIPFVYLNKALNNFKFQQFGDAAEKLESNQNQHGEQGVRVENIILNSNEEPTPHRIKLKSVLKELEKLDLNEKLNRLVKIIESEDTRFIKMVFEEVGKSNKIGEIWGNAGKLLIRAVVKKHDYEILEYLVKNQGMANLVSLDESDMVYDDGMVIFKKPTQCENASRILQLLIKANPERVNSKYYDGKTPLLNAIGRLHEKQFELINMLISYNADVNASDNLGCTPLIALVSSPHTISPHFIDIFKLLIEQGADLDALDVRSRDFFSEAAKNLTPQQYHEVVVYLVSIGKTHQFRSVNKNGEPFLSRLVKCMELLRETMEIFHKSIEVDFNVIDARGNPPLFYAVAGFRSVEFLKMMIEFGADSHGNMLHYAAEYGDLDAVKFCLSLGFDVNRRDRLLDTPLHKACQREPDTPSLFFPGNCKINLQNTYELVEELLEHGANANARNIVRMLPLSFAATRFRLGKFELRLLGLLVHMTLMQRNPENKIENNDYTNVNEKDLKHLIKYAGDWEDLNVLNYTVLHHVVEIGDLFAVKLFVALGYDVNAKNTLGLTPFHLALVGNMEGRLASQIVEVLKNNGGKIDLGLMFSPLPFPFKIILMSEEICEIRRLANLSRNFNALGTHDDHERLCKKQTNNTKSEPNGDEKNIPSCSTSQIHAVKGTKSDTESKGYQNNPREGKPMRFGKTTQDSKKDEKNTATNKPVDERFVKVLNKYYYPPCTYELGNLEPGNEDPIKIEQIIQAFNRSNKKVQVVIVRDLIAFESLPVIKSVLENLAKTKRINGIWSKKYRSLLHTAVARREYEVVEYLLKSHDFVSVLSTDKFKNSLISTCILDIPHVDSRKYHNKKRVVKLLFKTRPEFVTSSTIESVQVTPLHVAAGSHFTNTFQVDFIRFLLDHGADVNARDSNGMTVLQWTVFNPFDMVSDNILQIVQILVDSGADLAAVAEEGSTFMHLLPWHANPDQIHDIVSFVAALDASLLSGVNSTDGKTVLHNISHLCNPLEKTLEAFKSHGVDFNAVDKEGDSILFYAIGSGKNRKFLYTLIKLGCDWRIGNKLHENAIHQAAFFGNLSALQLFIELGCDLDAKNSLGDTPLHKALMSKADTKIEIVKVLLKNFANLNARNKFGMIPLDVANAMFQIGELDLSMLQLIAVLTD